MVRAGKGSKMYKSIFIFVCMAMAFQGCSFKDPKSFTSTREYSVHEQDVFNIVKKMFHAEGSGEYIIDTSWHNLTLSKRELLYSPFSIEIKKIIYELHADEVNEKNIALRLKISAQREERLKEYYEKESFLHHIFWNRIEYALGLAPWYECSVDQKSIEPSSNYFAKVTQKESFLCDVKIEPKAKE